MAKALWNEPIDKHVDWAGDESTLGQPVAGQYVQSFIKDTLENKFGSLHYVKDAGSGGKYYIFADEENFNLWNSNRTLYRSLVLASFDAPSPATIKTGDYENIDNPIADRSKSIIVGETGQEIKFRYVVKDNTDNPIAEAVVMDVTFTTNTGSTRFTRTLPANPTITKDGDQVSFGIDQYINKEGIYNITVTLTGSTTQATTSIVFVYTVIDMKISWSLPSPFAPEDTVQHFTIGYTVSGAYNSNKFLEIFIDGSPLIYPDNIGWNNVVAHGDDIGSSGTINQPLYIYRMPYGETTLLTWPDKEGVPANLVGKEMLGVGKHSLQMRAYTLNEMNEKIFSETKYTEFVIQSTREDDDKTYLLYDTTLAPGENNIFDPGQPIAITANQYAAIEFRTNVFNTKDKTVEIRHDLQRLNDEGTAYEDYDTSNVTPCDSGLTDVFIYTFTEATQENKPIQIKIWSANSDDVILVRVTVNQSVDIAETAGPIFKYTALNRSNASPTKDVWTNESKGMLQYYNAQAIFDENVLFVDGQTGWTGNSLRLNNGAKVTFPINLFAPVDLSNKAYDLSTDGLTFEIEFETSNVIDGNARLLDYSDEYENSYIRITATSAEIKTQQGAYIKTNFKEDERIKLAFIISPIRKIAGKTVETPDHIKYPNTVMIMVNGVLDRACKWGEGEVGTDRFTWATGKGNSFTFGDIDNGATVELKSMRIYASALSFDEELNNYIADAPGDTIEELYNKNNVVENNEVSFKILKTMIPTMVMGINYRGDDSSINNTPPGDSSKKWNHVAEVQYYDPNDANLNFFAKNVYISCQGTSSMNYPTKNLRMYFAKTMNKNFHGHAGVINEYVVNGNDRIDTGNTVKDKTIIISEFETEFWPYAAYGSEHEDTMPAYSKQILPYSVNKKVDGADGSDPCDEFDGGAGKKVGVVHEGYHKVGSNRKVTAKAELVKNYFTCSDDYWTKDANGKFINTPHRPEFYILKPGSGPLVVTDAFGKDHALYASTGYKGYINRSKTDELGDSTYADYIASNPKMEGKDNDYAKRVIDNFILATIEHEGDNYFISSGEDLERTPLDTFLSNNDIYISAYRPLANNVQSFTEEGKSDELWEYEKELRYSGAKFYTRTEVRDDNGNITKVTYAETKKGKPLLRDVFYFSLGSYWRQYNDVDTINHYGRRHVSGWTDRWTLKADFAESSMTHNAGIGRLWTEALRSVSRTKAQIAVNDFIDIRTGCDGKPMVMFVKQLLGYNSVTGEPVYDDIKYVGLFNIMTDKSSTKLFGFEDIYNETGTKIWSADNVQCWEGRNNSSSISMGTSVAFDPKGDPDVNNKKSLGENRLIFGTYESRFPDSGQERHEYDPSDTENGGYLGNNWPDDVYGVETNHLESFLRWLHFCMPALEYKIGDYPNIIDGYNTSDFNKFDILVGTDVHSAQYYYGKLTDALAVLENSASTPEQISQANADIYKYNIYYLVEKDGNIDHIALTDNETVEYNVNQYAVKELFESCLNGQITGVDWYRRETDINFESVHKKASNEKIPEDIYIIPIESFDSKWRCGQGADKNEEEANKYLVNVYATYRQNRLWFENEYGEDDSIPYASIEGFEIDNYEKTSNGQSWKGKKYIDYFNATWKDHLDPEKVAAYYVYMIRFGATDQVVKNTMMATEDGQHWYFINYDNDTILGVRNDGHLVYNWDVTRDTYDSGVVSYAYAGTKSVLWNTLEICEEFMDMVKSIDKNLYTNGYLSANTVLTWLNEYQEGVWCERLYNYQEETKYISTFKEDFSLTNFLAFTQGTRESHRNWWVTKRWDLYDSQWNSGLYDSQYSAIYMNNDGTSNNTGLFMITAASDYTFELSIANNRNDGWKPFIKRNDTYMFELFNGGKVKSPNDPSSIWGMQKIKVLNFRPILFNGQNGAVGANWNLDANVSWIASSGSLMTKFLLGSNDVTKKNGITSIQGINEVYSLEEIDIRQCNQLNSLTINRLNNLHRFRAAGSTIMNFNPAIGANLYEVSLPDRLYSLALNKTIFRKDPAEYVAFQTGKVLTYENEYTNVAQYLNNPTFGSYVEDTLPPYNATESYNPFKYCKTYTIDENGVPSLKELDASEKNAESGYVFDYVPTASLNNVTFNNVTGLDTYTFLNDWYDALFANNENSFVDVDGFAPGETIKQCQNQVSLTGFQWIFENTTGKTAAKQFIEMYRKFKWTSFTGTAYLKDFDQESYDLLIEEFGQDVFNPTNGVVVTTGARTYFNPKSNTENYKLKETAQNNKYYEVSGGTNFEVKADIFPVSSTIDYVYVLRRAPLSWDNMVYNGNILNVGPGDVCETLDNTHNKEVFGLKSGDKIGVSLTNSSGSAILTVDPDSSFWSSLYQQGAIFRIDVYGYTETGEIDYTKDKLWTGDQSTSADQIYVKFVQRSIPETSKIKIGVEGGDLQASTLTITDKGPKTLVVDLGQDTFNVGIKNIYAYSNENDLYSTTWGRTGLGTVATISNVENEMNKFNLEYDLMRLHNFGMLDLFVAVELDDSQKTKIKKSFKLDIQSKPVDHITLETIEDTPEQISSIELRDLDVYKFKVNLLNANDGPVNIDYRVSAAWKADDTGITNVRQLEVKCEKEEDSLVLSVNTTRSLANATEFYGACPITITATPDTSYNNTGLEPYRQNFNCVIEVRMPDKISLKRLPIDSDDSPAVDEHENPVYIEYDNSNGVSVNLFNINLTMNEQYNGAGNTEPVPVYFVPSNFGNLPTVHNVAVVIDKIEITMGNEHVTYTDKEDIKSNMQDGIQFGKYTISGDQNDHYQYKLMTSYNDNDFKNEITINAGTDDANSYESIDGMYIYITKPDVYTNASNAVVSITLHAEYDMTELDKDYTINKTTSQVFDINISRSTHTASTYKKLSPVNTNDKYVLYAVDNKNRFFEFECTKTGSEFEILPKFNNVWDAEHTPQSVTGNASSDWRGVGFVTSSTIGGKVVKTPYFLSFEKYIKIGFNDNANVSELNMTPLYAVLRNHRDIISSTFGIDISDNTWFENNFDNTAFTALNTGSSGYNNTKVLAEFVDSANLFNSILNTYEDTALYIPSVSEISVTLGSGVFTSGESLWTQVPSNEMLAVNALAKWMAESDSSHKFIDGITLHAPVGTDMSKYEPIVNDPFDSNKHFSPMGGGVYRFGTSTIERHENTLNGQYVQVGTIKTSILNYSSSNHTYYTATDDNIKLPNNTYNDRLVIVPFVHVI